MGELTVTDLFCGAGGSSCGAEQVPGVRVRMAANHWRLAVETHNANLPHADHDVADISQVDPRRYPATDLLWASPECTNHSQARGRKRAGAQPGLFGEALPDEAADRSRATMWDVPRFVEAMILRGRPYRGFVVENVVDVVHWLYFDAWVLALRAAGYCLHFVYLNSMHAQGAGLPAPQSRDRWYCLGHLRAARCPDLDRWARPAAWCPRCERQVRCAQSWKRPDRAPWGRYRQQYVWRCPAAGCRAQVEPATLPAAAAIDWSLPGARIGDRARPLAAKTRKRIEAGLRKHARPVALEAAGGTSERRPGVRAWPAHGLAAPPMLVPAGGTWNEQARPVSEPFRTRTTRDAEALACPQPFLAVLRNNATSQRVDAPLGTVTAAGNHHGLVIPPGVDGTRAPSPLEGCRSLAAWPWMVVDYNGPARRVCDPLPAQTTVAGCGLCSVEAAVDDCLFRMLEPHEIKLAMAFEPGYVLLGNKREQVRLAGNAVTPPAARDLVTALAEAVTGEEVSAA
jgi:DNA (cytosine-5)-methyltransferase 1